MNDNDLKLAEQIKRASSAREITEHPMYVEAITAIRADLFQKFTHTKSGDSDERDELWRKNQAIDWFEKYLKTTIETGRLAQDTLLQRAKKKLRLA